MKQLITSIMLWQKENDWNRKGKKIATIALNGVANANN